MNRKTVLYALAIMNFTNIVDSMLMMPLGDVFIKAFDISAAEFGWLVSVYAFAATVSGIIAFFILDNYDRKKALLFVYSGFAIGTFLCALAPTYTILLLLRLFTGLFGGVIGALVLAIVSDLYDFKERGSAMGIVFAAFSAASALGIPIGLYLAAKGSWQTPFFILGLLAMVIVVIAAITFPKMTKHLGEFHQKKSMRTTIQDITSDNNQVNALIAGFVLVMAHFMIIPFISPFLIKNIGLTQVDIAKQFFLGGLATVFTSPIVGKLTDKYGVNRVFTTMMLLCFIPTLAITHLQAAPLIYTLTLTTLFFVFASGRMIPANTIITASTGIGNRGSFMAIKSALQQLAIGLSALISGHIVFINLEDQYENYNLVGYLAVGLGLSTIYFIRKLRVSKGN